MRRQRTLLVLDGLEPLHRLRGDAAIADLGAARHDLDEALEIAQRGDMRLHQADAHLEYARHYLSLGDPAAARAHLSHARRLVEDTGYARRAPDVAVLEAELGSGQ